MIAPEINRLQERLETIQAAAFAIRDEAARQNRDLTAAEIARAQQLFAEFDEVETELRLSLPGRVRPHPASQVAATPPRWA